MAKHHLITIGIRGQKRAYLDLGVDEAIMRCCMSDGMDLSDAARTIEVIEFDDEFEVYDAWPSEIPEPVPMHA